MNALCNMMSLTNRKKSKLVLLINYTDQISITNYAKLWEMIKDHGAQYFYRLQFIVSGLIVCLFL